MCWKLAIENRVRLTPREEDSPGVSPPHATESDGLSAMFEDFLKNMRLQNQLETEERFAIPFTDPELPTLLDAENCLCPASVAYNTSRSQKATRPVRVMFPSMARKDKDFCKHVVKKSGGLTLDGALSDATCTTHLVVSRLDCTKKVMFSVAAGKWIVNP